MDRARDIHNYHRRLERTIERIETSEEFSEHNRKIVLKFKDSLLAENISPAKTSRYLQDVIWLNRQWSGKKKFDSANREDIIQIVAKMNQSSLAESTKKGLKIMLRKLYRNIRGITEKGKYPSEVDFFTLTISKSNQLIPEELLTEEEVYKIVKCCRSERD